MYCPKCATQNVDDASFCRACGANISLVPQALTGNLPVARANQDELESQRAGKAGHHKRKDTPTLEKGVENIFMGVGFLFVSLAVMKWAPAGQIWWFWLLIPAFAMLGGGVGTIIRAKREQKLMAPFNPAATIAAVPPPQRFGNSRSHSTPETVAHPPTSVTEGTTRHLDAVGSAKSRSIPTEQ